MYKNNIVSGCSGGYYFLFKILAMLKIALVIITTSFIQASAAVYAQRASITVENSSLKDVFTLLREQTGYHFLYLTEDLEQAGPITLKLKDVPVETILDHCFRDKPFSYRISDGRVLITRHSAGEASLPQQGLITGWVADSLGNPLAGVSVTIGNTRKGTSTDAQGRFTIMAGAGEILSFRLVGFEAKQAAADGKMPLQVVLTVAESELDEVVVVGYGMQKKANLTGAVSTVDFTDLDNVPQANTANALSGRLAGVSVVQSGGQPGEDAADVAIRGLGTLNDTSPLVIIDGVAATLADLGNLPPQDIANVSVLKDASSAAIYGARGGNGVILVTTRMPTKERINISVSAYTGFQRATYLPQMVESWQYMTLMNEAVDVVRYSPELIDSARNGIFSDNIANTKWFEHLFGTAPMQNYSLTISGKNKGGTTFQLSGSFMDQEGVLRNTSSQRYTVRGAVNTKVNKFIHAALNVWGYERRNKAPFAATNALIRDALLVPIMPVRYANGEYATYNMNVRAAGGQIVGNPVLDSEIGYSNQDIVKINAQPSLEIVPVKGLKLRSAFTYSFETGRTRRFNPTFSYNSNFGMPSYENKISSLIELSNSTTQMQWQTTLSYKPKLEGAHSLQGLLGHEVVDYRASNFRAQGDKLPSNLLPVLGNATSNFAVGGDDQEWALQSFFGRVNYDYANRYLLEVSLRTDGSSRLNGEYRLSPSGSAGWVLSEEPFFEGLKGVVPFFKIRAGFGKLGNDRVGNYTFQQALNLSGYYSIGGELQTAASITEFGNPWITWEQTTTSNLGADIGLLSNKLHLNLDFYRRLTDGILFRLPMPLSFGNPGAPMQNVASVSNRGIEVAIEHLNTVGGFRYAVTGNVSYNQNRIEQLNKQRIIIAGGAAGLTLMEEGYPINSWFGYISDGLLTQEDIDNKYPLFHTAMGVGSLKFRDINENGVIDEGDRTVIGDGMTPYTFGLNTALSYKGFDFSLLLQGVADKDIYIYDRGNRPGNGGQINFWREWWTRSYHPERNPNGDWPIIKSQSPDAAASSSHYLTNASYVRLKNVEVGYSLPASLRQRLKMGQARIYAAAQNAFTISSVTRNLDPERSNFQKNNLPHPQILVFTVGVNASF